MYTLCRSLAICNHPPAHVITSFGIAVIKNTWLPLPPPPPRCLSATKYSFDIRPCTTSTAIYDARVDVDLKLFRARRVNGRRAPAITAVSPTYYGVPNRGGHFS